MCVCEHEYAYVCVHTHIYTYTHKEWCVMGNLWRNIYQKFGTLSCLWNCVARALEREGDFSLVFFSAF